MITKLAAIFLTLVKNYVLASSRLVACLLTLVFLNSAIAQEPVILDKGQEAPYKGILLETDRAKEAMKAEKKVLTLEMLRGNLEEQISFHKEDAKNSRKRLTEAKWNGFWENSGYFLLGCILTSVAFKVNREIQR